jgi:hypothetical protein
MAERRQSGASSAGKERSPRGAGADSGSASDGGPRTPGDHVRALYEQAESSNAQAFEEFVSKPSFGWVLARSAENVAALSRIGADFADLWWRTFRVASRADVTRLARQLHRTEDKLERVLQEVEQLRDEVSEREQQRGANGGGPKATDRVKARP